MDIVTVCGMGLGTSMMVKLSIDKILKQEGILARVNPVDLGSFKTAPADIVVAPKDMERQVSGTSADVVLLNNLTDTNEIREKLLPVVRGHLSDGA